MYNISLDNNDNNDNNLAIIMCVCGKDSPIFFDLALQSLFEQSNVNIDVYLFVDGHIDSSIETVINFYLNKYFTNLYIKRGHVSQGLPYGLNVLIDLALHKNKYKFFARMDSDDICLPDRFTKQLDYFKLNKNIDVIGSGIIEINESGERIGVLSVSESNDDIKSNIIKSSPIKHPTAMFRANVFEDGIRYDQKYPVAQDYELWIRLIKLGYKLGNVNKPLLLFRKDKNFYKRRSLNRVIPEVMLKIRAIRILSLNYFNYFYLLPFLIIRLSPPIVVSLAYRYLRNFK